MIVRDSPAHRLTLECDDQRAGMECRVSVDITAETAERCAEIIVGMGWVMGADGRVLCPCCAFGVAREHAATSLRAIGRARAAA